MYECVVQSSSLGRTSVLYRLKVLPSFATSIAGDSTQQATNKESNLNMKVNNSTSTRSRKSVLDSHHPKLADWSTKLTENEDNSIETNKNSNNLDNTILSLRNVTVSRLGEKATLRCVVDGILAQPHFRVSVCVIIFAYPIRISFFEYFSDAM